MSPKPVVLHQVQGGQTWFSSCQSQTLSIPMVVKVQPSCECSSKVSDWKTTVKSPLMFVVEAGTSIFVPLGHSGGWVLKLAERSFSKEQDHRQTSSQLVTVWTNALENHPRPNSVRSCLFFWGRAAKRRSERLWSKFPFLMWWPVF